MDLIKKTFYPQTCTPRCIWRFKKNEVFERKDILPTITDSSSCFMFWISLVVSGKGILCRWQEEWIQLHISMQHVEKRLDISARQPWMSSWNNGLQSYYWKSVQRSQTCKDTYQHFWLEEFCKEKWGKNPRARTEWLLIGY